MQYSTCPRCGRKCKTLNAETGLCRACNELQRTEDQRRLNVQIYREIHALENGTDHEYIVNKRRHDAIRQENSRLCRKHGLPGLRERKRRGDFVEMSKEMSNRRSSDQEVS